MKITSKGQVTIPPSVRQQAGLHPHTEVEWVVLPNRDVILRAVAKAVPSSRDAFQRARGSANAAEFKGMGTDEFIKLLRG